MKCTSPFEVRRQFGSIYVPCGQCLACRINRTRDWKFRCLLELKGFNDLACFVTLTYNDENLPVSGSLVKQDLQKFLKRLRKAVYPKKIKYYSCGEYGDKNNRPHYHLILFGLGVDSFTRQLLKTCWTLCNPERFDFNDRCLAFCESDSIGYVCGYVQKKVLGKGQKESYYDKGLLPPFQCCSQKLGLSEFAKNKDFYNSLGGILYHDKIYRFPRYFLKKFNLDVSEKKHYSLNEKVKRLLDLGYDRDSVQSLCVKGLVDSALISSYEDSYKQLDINLQAKLNLKELKL